MESIPLKPHFCIFSWSGVLFGVTVSLCRRQVGRPAENIRLYITVCSNTLRCWVDRNDTPPKVSRISQKDFPNLKLNGDEAFLRSTKRQVDDVVREADNQGRNVWLYNKFLICTVDINYIYNKEHPCTLRMLTPSWSIISPYPLRLKEVYLIIQKMSTRSKHLYYSKIVYFWDILAFFKVFSYFSIVLTISFEFYQQKYLRTPS